MKRFALLAAPFAAVLLLGVQGPCNQLSPVVTSVSPAVGPDTGGTEITIHGQDFHQQVLLTIGGTVVGNVQWLGPTQLKAVTPPALKLGPVDVSVTNLYYNVFGPVPTPYTLNNGFTYVNSPPEIESVEPAQGPTFKGIVIKVNGNGFDENATLLVGGVQAKNVWRNGPNQLIGTTPLGPAGPADVTVKEADGSTYTLPNGFTYVSSWNESFRALFDQRDQAFNNGDGYKDYTNEQGSLAWGESYLMNAYAVMYEATKDPWYLKKLADHADAVLENRDDARGVADYRGVSGAGWRNFQNGAPYCWVVHTGMITYPMARFAAIVKADTSLQSIPAFDGISLLQKASTYIQRVKESVAFHEWEWQYGPYGDMGHYKFPNNAPGGIPGGVNVPYNHQNAMGRTLVALYGATGDTYYRDKASRLAVMFKGGILSGDNIAGYVWHYWDKIGEPFWNGTAEDISHAAINVDFAVRAHQAGVVFTAADMTGFVWTFRNRVASMYVGQLNNRVDGGGGRNAYNLQSGRWLALGPWDWDRLMFSTVKYIYQPAFGWSDIPDPSVLLSIAYLARWE